MILLIFSLVFFILIAQSLNPLLADLAEDTTYFGVSIFSHVSFSFILYSTSLLTLLLVRIVSLHEQHDDLLLPIWQGKFFQHKLISDKELICCLVARMGSGIGGQNEIHLINHVLDWSCLLCPSPILRNRVPLTIWYFQKAMVFPH